MCPAETRPDAEASEDIGTVTCKRCLDIHAKGRWDTKEAVKAVLTRGFGVPEECFPNTDEVT